MLKQKIRFQSFTTGEVSKEYLVEVVIDSELKITDVEWSNDLNDPESEMYIEMQNDFEEDMELILCDEVNSTLQNDTCSVQVTGFTEGSVNVLFSLIKIVLEILEIEKDDADILAEMAEKISTKGMKKFKVDEKSLKISKLTLFLYRLIHKVQS